MGMLIYLTDEQGNALLLKWKNAKAKRERTKVKEKEKNQGYHIFGFCLPFSLQNQIQS
jgi:hypothetical protein